MTIKEMHIEFNILLQRLNSNSLRSYESEEIDANLNWAIRSFIKNRSRWIANPQRRGFEVDEKRLQDLQELIIPANLNCYQDSVDAGRMYAYLPPNHYLTTGKKCNVSYDCKDGIANVVTADTVGYREVTINMSSITNWTGFKIEENGGGEIFNINDYTGLVVADLELFEVLELIKDKMYELGKAFYWESYGTKFQRNTFWLIYPESGSITGVTVTHNAGATTIVNDPQATDYDVWDKGNNTVSSAIVPIDIVSNDSIDDMRYSPFGKTKWENPIATVSDGLLYVYTDDKFIVDNVTLTYIRKPKAVNYKLGHNCDLNENFHDEIVNIAARKVAGIITSENYEGLMNTEISNQ